jgi:serpin B
MDVMRRIAVVVAFGLVAACGGDDGSPEVAPSSVPDTTEVEPVAAPGLLMATPGVERSAVIPDAPVEELVGGFNDAGFELLRAQPLGDNLVFSPASIGHALLMARAAADEPTGAAIDAAFGLPAGVAAHQAWNVLDQQLASAAEADESSTVTIADRIWPRVDISPEQVWIDLLAAEHGADVETLDFAGDPDSSRETINAWVDEQTHGLIPELLPEGFLRPETLLVLTDTLHFAADWQTPFGKYGPVDGTFTRLDGSTVPLELMQELELDDRRGRADGFAGAEIPYVGGEFSMLVLVPDEGRFAEVRDRIGQGLLDDIDATFTTGPYELLVPKWAGESQIDLLGWLSELGAAPGSYPGIDPAAFLDAAVHGANIEVDERGTVAAAATGLMFPSSGPPDPELTVRADKPFLYLIRHRASGLVLFAGQVTEPIA